MNGDLACINDRLRLVYALLLHEYIEPEDARRTLAGLDFQ